MSKALIFIPGIKGTKLYDSNTVDNEILWQDFRFNFEDYMRLEMTFESEQFYYDQDLNSIIKPLHIEPLAYREFWNDLEYEHKYIFPYDWRLSNEHNSKLLTDFIDYLTRKSKALGKEFTHFDFVTHSMGNIPLRYYIKQHGMGKINKILFVSPPFKGSPDAISALVIGQGFFFNKDKIRKLARTLPALFELLPTYDFHAIDSVTGNPIDLWDIENWQENVTKNDDGSREKQIEIDKFTENLSRAKMRLDDLDKWKDNLSPAEKSRIMVLVKSDFETRGNVIIEKNPTDYNPKNYFDFNVSLISEDGDGVVPHASSCHYYRDFHTYYFNNRILRDDYKHAFVMKDERIQKVINEFLDSPDDTTKFKVQIYGRTVFKVEEMEVHTVVSNGLPDYKTIRIRK